MEKLRKGTGWCFRLLALAAMLMVFCIPVSAGKQEAEGEYEIYPTPQKVTYGTGNVQLTDEIKLNIGSGIDSYTEARIDAALDVLDLTGNENAASGKTTLTVGVYGSGDAADAYGQANGAEASLFEKNDAYMLIVKGSDIVILGKNTDAAYYGVTTLKRIFEQLEGKAVRELTVEDYSEVEFRGFIEGYYGNPWSMDDRIDLMKFGSEIKMNQYVFAPKDDPYHNAKWRELYPDAELENIARLAQTGNESKCFFVYALHPFMNNAINLSDSTYESELNVIKAKFAQVIGAGVRQIAILEDDAQGETADHMIKFLNDMNAWLHELKETTYPDLKTDILYCPTCYMATSNSKMTTIGAGVSREIHIVVTGGKIWGEVSSEFADNFYTGMSSGGAEGRYPYMWVNWPCNDNTKTSQIMGGHNYILHTGVDGSKYEGIILNPIQESEPSKVGIFTAADYCWQTWDSAEEGDQAWDDAFKYIDHMTAIESEESAALKEIAKHMIAQGPEQITPGKQVWFEESVELSPKLADFTEKLNAGTLEVSDTEALQEEFQKINDAVKLYMEKGTNRRMASQMIPFMSCLRDLTQADVNLISAVKAILTSDKNGVWENFSAAQAVYEESQSYGFAYYNNGTIYAKAGRRYIEPFTETIIRYVSEAVKEVVNPEYVSTEKYEASVSHTSSWSVYSGNGNLTDGNDSTDVWYNNGSGSSAGEFIQLDLGGTKKAGRVRVLVGASGSQDKWTSYHLEYSADGQNWESLDAFTGASSGVDAYEVNLRGASVRYVKLVNDAATSKWVRFSEFSVYPYVAETDNGPKAYTNTENAGWNVEYGEDSSRVLPKANATLQPGEYVGLKLSRIRAVNNITVTGTGTEKLTLEKSVNQGEWKTAQEEGSARYIRLMNKSNQAVTFNLDSFVVTSDEIWPMDLLETTIGGESNSEDARKLGTTKYWMDGDLSTKAKYCSTPAKDGYVTYDLGQEIELHALKIYVLDTAIDYPRDALVQASVDNENWTDILEIGDGVANDGSDRDTKPVESNGGWKHDKVDVAYAYVENANIDNVKARYIRLYFTADYSARWVELNEILINGGEYIPSVNDPTYETDAALKKGYEAWNLSDNDLTTAFKPDGTQNGYLIYNLSDEKKIGRINILQSGSSISNAVVSVRTGADTWKKLGTLDKSFSSFYTKDLENVYAVKLEWENAAPVIYEIITLQNAGDILEEKLASVKEELQTLQSEVSAAELAVAQLEKKVSEISAKVSAAASTIDKLTFEAELANAEAERAAAMAAAAEKKNAAAEKESAVAKLEAEILREQASKADNAAEKSRLEAEAAEKENKAQEKQQEAEKQKALAADKKAEQISFKNAAAAKLEELKKAQTVTSVIYKNVKYKILNASKKTAAVYGAKNKKVKKLTIYKTVNIGGVTYKVTQINAKAFKGCKKLKKVVIGANVQKIGKSAFENCKQLRTVNMKKATGIKSIGKKAFRKIHTKAKITVPAKKLAAYKKKLKSAGVPKSVKIKK